MSIRRAKFKDIECIKKCDNILLESYEDNFYNMLFNLTGFSGYVIEEKSKIIGYILSVIDDEFMEAYKSHFWTNGSIKWDLKDFEEDEIGHIISFGVLEEFQRKGYGTKLLNLIEEDLSKRFKIEYFKLNVKTTNEIAYNLYKKIGYEVIEMEPRYYKDGSDAYLMHKMI